MHSSLGIAGGLCTLLLAAAAHAGPPYQTDDPEPTDLHHWEIYAFTTADGGHGDVDGEGGFDLNYGAAEGVQLTATIPAAFARSAGDGWRAGTGDVELAIKYRFFDDEKHGFSAAVFPRAILPTSTLAAHERTQLLLPIWLGKDFSGGTSLFGGGGYEINPGPGNRNFWQAGVALTHDFGEKVSLGTELFYQGADTDGGSATTGVDLGMIRKLGGPYSLLVAAGPSFSGSRTGYHSYVALGLNF
jgi:hypothetical protein